MSLQNSGEKTKLLIANSLRNLMKKKSLDKIKIREIVEDCGVNRQTFYYHFQDIYDLVEWMYTYDGLKIYNEYDPCVEWLSIVKRMLKYLEDNQEEINCIVNSKANKFFRLWVYDKVLVCTKYLVESLSKEMTIESSYKNFISEFYASAICNMVDNWMNTRHSTRMSANDLIRYFDLTMNGNLASALKRCEEETLKKIEEKKNS